MEEAAATAVELAQRFACRHCRRTFVHEQRRNNHEHREHGVALAPVSFPCPQCGKVFSKESKFKCHQKVHSDERPFGCGQCAMRFKRKKEVGFHQSVHSMRNRFVCERCSFRYADPRALTRHMNRDHCEDNDLPPASPQPAPSSSSSSPSDVAFEFWASHPGTCFADALL